MGFIDNPYRAFIRINIKSRVQHFWAEDLKNHYKKIKYIVKIFIFSKFVIISISSTYIFKVFLLFWIFLIQICKSVPKKCWTWHRKSCITFANWKKIYTNICKRDENIYKFEKITIFTFFLIFTSVFQKTSHFTLGSIDVSVIWNC